jgi:uncharacterized protein
MKILLVLVLVLAGVWLFRANRKSARQRTPPVQKPVTMALDMVRCQHCDTHLPQADAIAGKRGVYCSAEHRQQAES